MSCEIDFNYFVDNYSRLIAASYEEYDYSLYYNDLQNRNVSDDISVAETVGLFSVLANRPVLPSLVIVGRVVMSGGMMPVTTDLEEIFVAASNAGAKRMLLPEESANNYQKLSVDLKRGIDVVFYKTPFSVTVAFITFKILPSKFIFFILISTLKLPF